MKLVLFDCDGTLVDSQNMIVAAMLRAFAANELVAPSREAILSIVGLSLPTAMIQLTGYRGGAKVDALVDAYRTAFHELRKDPAHREPLFPGAREAIETLAARPDVLMGIVTGKSRRGLEAILQMHDLRHHFVVTRTADDAPSKPDPTMVIEAMAEVGALPAATVVIGDTTFDVEMARNAGAHAIGVSWGYHTPASLQLVGAWAVLDDFVQLVPAIDGLLAGESVG